jgi:hypothetical protein
MIVRWLRWSAVTLAAVAIAAFAGDWLIFHLRGEPTSKVTVSHFLSAPLKNNKQELDYLGSDEETCSNSLFPQGTHLPCWYLRRHTNQVNSV